MCVRSRVHESVCVCAVRDICLHFPSVVSPVPVKAKSSLAELTPSAGQQTADERGEGWGQEDQRFPPNHPRSGASPLDPEACRRVALSTQRAAYLLSGVDLCV